jgi:hypothetical protein
MGESGGTSPNPSQLPLRECPKNHDGWGRREDRRTSAATFADGISISMSRFSQGGALFRFLR